MKTPRTIVSSALVASAFFFGIQARADNMASVAIAPATGVVTLTPRWALGGNLAGFHHMAQNLGLTGSVANNFYSIRNGTIPAGGDVLAFNFYVAGSGSATPHADIGSKLTPSSYSALTSADPDVGYGSVNLYLIHHKGTTDYFTAIIPGSASASAVTDEKPMSGPGGPGTVTGVSGYFGLTFAASNLGYGLNNFYYLRTDPATGTTKFGTLAPALLGSSADQFDLGTGGHNALAFTGTDVGFGTDKMYYLRLDPVTGFTIFGMLNPALAGTRHTSDIANLGSVYSSLTFAAGDVGFGSNQFYTTGAVNTTWQSVSFAAIADRAISAGSFTVTPSASSALPVTVTVVAGSIGNASISTPVGGVFTITPTAPGLITLQATQAGQAGLFEFNMLRQSFTASGTATLTIAGQSASQSVALGTNVNLSVTASGTTTLSYQWRKAGVNITGNASALTATLSLPNVQVADAASYDVVVTNASGSITSTAILLSITGSAPGIPAITNPSLSVAGTLGVPFNFTVAASNTPTSFAATSLPAGLAINSTTGAITGTPIAAGVSTATISATNGGGTGIATLTITVAAATVTPVITGPTTAPATLGTAFSFTIASTGLPTSFTATGLPAGLTLNTATGVISGTPTTAGSSVVTLTATNSAGTSTSTLTITVAGATVAPVITSPLTAPGTLGVPFTTYLIAATGLPTSYTAFNLPPGLALNSTTGAINGTPTATGTTFVTLTATNSAGTSTATLMIVIAAATGAPVITSPITALGTAGTPFVTFVIAATGTPTSYTATGLPAGLTLNPVTGAINGTPTTPGSYVVTVTATNSTGTTTGTVTIVVAAPLTVLSSRIVNFSARAASGPGDQTLIMGFVVSGNNKNLLIRGVGPTLGLFGITNPLADPLLTLFDASAAVATNDDWSINSAGQSQATVVAAAAAQVGAFALPAGSKDSALIFTVNNGAHTTGLLRPNSTTGTALTEIYDLDTAPTARLINVSARMNVGTGEATLIAGFVIAGNTPKTVLIRGIGPALGIFGVTGLLADPQISVVSNGTQIASNNDWSTGSSTAAQVSAAAASVGAFALPAGSKDAALFITLQPGAYTVQVTGVGNTTGVALIEIYDMP